MLGGAEWFSSMGTEKSKGYTLYSLSGHVKTPGQYEAPLGITLRQLLDLSGGMREGHRLKFWTPGGSSTPLLTEEHLDVPLDYEGVAAAGSMLGTKALQCFDETTCVVRAVLRWTEFYAHESCGKCTPCREGTYWMVQVLQRLEAGTGTEEDIATLLDTCDNIFGRSFCALGDGATSPIVSGVQYFRDEFVAHITNRGCPFDPVASTVFAVSPAPEHRVTVTSPSTADVVPTDLVTLTIDGFEVAVPKGTLVIRAAELVGIQIPRFCDHPLLDPVGACRQCIVEVEGQRKPLTACTTTVTEGMVVKTQLTSPVAKKAQEGTLELLLINHPLDCPVCDKGGECPLQNQTMSNGNAESRFHDVKRTYPKPIAISSQVLLDRERCVLCARCTRFQQQVAGDPFIELFERGALQQVAIYSDQPFESYFSGNTVQICPVGALTGAAYRFRARPFDLVSSPMVCEHCASGCALRTDHRRGKVLRRLAGDDPQVNEEWNCDKGRWAFTYSSQDDRLATPLVRDYGTGRLRPASWTEALDRAAEGLRLARGEHGVGVLPGGRLTVEDAYAYAKFARVVLRTNDVDSRVRPHSAEEQDFLAAHVAGRYAGQPGVVTYADLECARTVLLAGFEPEEESPIVFLRLRKAVRRTRHPRLHASRRSAPRARSRPPPGCCRPRPAARRPCWPACSAPRPETAGGRRRGGRRRSASPAPMRARRRAPRRRPRRAVRRRPPGDRHRRAPGLGAPPRRRARRGRRRHAARACCPAAAPPTRPPTCRRVGRACPRRPAATSTASSPPPATGELSALVVGAVDPADCPDPHLALDALDAVPFLVSLELRRSPVTDRADVVLPVAAAVEKAGTYLDWEGRARPFEAVLTRVGSLTDGRVLHVLADEMEAELGLPDVARRPRRDRPPGRLLRAAPRRPSTPSPLAEPQAGEALLATWHWLLDDGSLQDGEPFLAGTAKKPRLHLSAATAAEVGVAEGQLVTVSSDRGSLTLPLVVADLPDRVVWVPTRTPDAAVRRDLAVGPGAVVRIAATAGGAA